MAGWTHPLGLLQEELIQRRDEGCEIPADLAREIAAVPEEHAWASAIVDPLYDRLMVLEPDAALAAAEPNELDAIRALRPDGPRDLGWKPDDATLVDRLHGAWLGRASGCALGKPVEGIGMAREGGKNGGDFASRIT